MRKEVIDKVKENNISGAILAQFKIEQLLEDLDIKSVGLRIVLEQFVQVAKKEEEEKKKKVDWTVNEVCAWLSARSMPNDVVQLFRENDISGAIIAKSDTVDDLLQDLDLKENNDLRSLLQTFVNEAKNQSNAT
jgi:peptide subunit release factor 1 (eRF1)